MNEADHAPNSGRTAVSGERVEHPAHYGGEENPYEAIKIIEHFDLNFHLGNSLKYIIRAGRKPETPYIEDLQKALWYLDREIKNATVGTDG